MSAVLEGIRILEVAEHTFVPAASALMADWGAEVIKVEHVSRGDAMRGLMSTGTAGFGGGVQVLLEHSNRGKKSIGLDLTTDEGVDILYRLAATSDVFLTNKMAGVRERLRIDVDDIRRANPAIVYVRGTGYGSRGPDADAGGYDFLGFWARAGSAESATPSDVKGRVVQPGPGYGDSVGAVTIAAGIATALLHRERTGEAHVVDVSLLATGMWALGGAIAVSQQTGLPWRSGPTTNVGTPSNPLIGMYRTADDRYIALSMLQGFHYWPEFCERIDRPDLVGDERFSTVETLMANAPEASAIVADELASRPLAEWRKRFDGMKGQWSVAQNTVDIADDPQVVANGYLQQLETAEGAPFTLVTAPVQFDDEPAVPRRSPAFNEHGDELLADLLGLDWDAIIDLKTKGIVP
jgi:crotonobetainyl-CoA:carnitine CoA-transferase CaiB-like acyl-CoA transferase